MDNFCNWGAVDCLRSLIDGTLSMSIMNEKYMELIIEADAGVDRERLQDRLSHEGIEALPMKVGMLLAGKISALRAAIPSLTGEETDEIPVPENLNDAVKAIRIVKPRSLL
jgi:hypothetical protein